MRLSKNVFPFKKVKCHKGEGGGGLKSAEKMRQVLIEWPLIHNVDVLPVAFDEVEMMCA